MAYIFKIKIKCFNIYNNAATIPRSCNRSWITSRNVHILEATCQATAIQSRLYAPGSEKAASIFQRLRPIWSSTTIDLNVKLLLYTAIVIPKAMCESWKRTAMVAHRLDVFHRRCLRVILGITWREQADLSLSKVNYPGRSGYSG